MEEHFLPRLHPKISENKPLKIIKINTKEFFQPYLYINTKQYRNNINLTSPSSPSSSTSSLPSSSSSSSSSSSLSIYKDGYKYMTEYEKERMEENIKKSKFLAGSFKGYSGIASAMPCRKEGLIRTSSKYLSPLQPHPKDKNKPIYGVWQPT